MRLSTKTF